MSFNADNFLAFGGLALGTIGTVAITKELVNVVRDTTNTSRRPMPKRMVKQKPMKPRRNNNRYSIENLSRLG